MTKSWIYSPGPHRDFIGFDRELRERGFVRTSRIGRSVVRLMNSGDMMDCLLEIGRLDPAFALCDNPNCDDCVRQRADLRRDLLAAEPFTVAVAASLAGSTVSEIAAACHAAGIDSVELDAVEGKTASALTADDLKTAIDRLRREGCSVLSLRGAVAAENPAALLGVASECGVSRTVFPLTKDAAALAETAASAGVGVSFYNVDGDSRTVFEAMRALRDAGSDAGLTFNACNFARLGEKPFLTSYSNRLKRFIDQLDVEDCTFAGTPTPLAAGNAEIVELISILRCSSFAGLVVLGAGNRSVSEFALVVRSARESAVCHVTPDKRAPKLPRPDRGRACSRLSTPAPRRDRRRWRESARGRSGRRSRSP